MPAEGRENPLLKKGNSDAFFREKYLTKNTDVLVSPYFRYHRYRYSINEECIDIREGYLFVERNIVPIERLHKLQTVKGPLDRFFRVAKVVVTTAGGDVTIRFLEEEKAEAIAESLRNRINQIVKEERNAKEQAADGQA